MEIAANLWCGILDEDPILSQCTTSISPSGIRSLAGWNQTDNDWKRIFHYQPDGCFVIECEGEAAGTATTTCYGNDLAWIGMVLVDPRFRRRGLATALMEHCLQFLEKEKGIACVRLDATPEGQTVYEKLGFRLEYETSPLGG